LPKWEQTEAVFQLLFFNFAPYQAPSLFPSPTNQLAKYAVNVPNNPTPTIINKAAIILPSVVTGNLSP
jgi:hypothetical protein